MNSKGVPKSGSESGTESDLELDTEAAALLGKDDNISSFLQRRRVALLIAPVFLFAAGFLVLSGPSNMPVASDLPKSHFKPPKLEYVASLDEGFEMLMKKMKAGETPVHAKYRQQTRFPEDVAKEIRQKQRDRREKFADAAIDELDIYGSDGGEPDFTTDEDIITLGKCLITVDQAVFALASAGLSIEAATRDCVNMTHDDKISCSSDTISTVTNIGWMTSFLFYAPAFCGFQDIVLSWCGGDWAWFIANAGSLTATGLSTAVDCKHANSSAGDPVIDPSDGGRRLADTLSRRGVRGRSLSPARALSQQLAKKGGHFLNLLSQSPEFLQPQEIAWQEAMEAATRLKDRLGFDNEIGRRRLETGRRLAAIRSGRTHDEINCAITVNAAAMTIASEIFNGWSTYKVCQMLPQPQYNNPEYKGLCAAGVIGLTQFGLDGTSIGTGLAGTCPQNGAQWTYCVSDITGMASSVMSYGSWSGTINHDCADAFWPDDTIQW